MTLTGQTKSYQVASLSIGSRPMNKAYQYQHHAV